MATGIGPKKSLFKRRAGPVIVQKIAEPNTASSTTIPTPTSFTNTTSSGLSALTQDGGSFNADSDSSPPRPVANDPGINLFRRAKHFYPKTIEASLRGAETQVQAKSQKQAGANGHDLKRRKVSSEQDSEAFRSRSGSPLRHDGHDVTSPVELRDSSGSPSPPRRLDKGKGLETQHTVNAGIVFTDGSNSKKRASSEVDIDEDTITTKRTTTKTKPDTTAVDDSVILLEDSDSEDIKPLPQRARKDSWEEDEDGISAKKGKGLRGLNDDIKVDDDGDDLAEVIDPEFEEYIIRARAQDAASRAAKEVQDINARLAANTRRSASGDHAAGNGANDAETNFDSQATASSAATAVASSDSQSRPLGEQSYRIFITPRLPESVPPLIANVRMDQEMRHVKRAFIAHAFERGYEMPPDVSKSVLLTWKGSKIYDFTTGLTLNLNPDAKGRFRRTDALDNLSRVTEGGSNGSHKVSPGFVSGGLHIEIWTEELYEKYIMDQEKQRRRNMGETLEEDLLSDDDDEDVHDVNDAHEVKRESSMGNGGNRQQSQQAHDKIRLVLASRSYDKLSVTAHSDTTIDTLIQAFRIQRDIADDKIITIRMDGEQLEGDSTVGEAEMEDMDSVEVHIN